MPTTPQKLAGWRIEPPVSVPRATGASPAATAAAEPPDEPPGMRIKSHGLRVTWNALFSVDEPIANSSMFVLPTMTASALRRVVITWASYGGLKFCRIFDPQVVTALLVQSTSLTAT